jgi:hypothetical protein
MLFEFLGTLHVLGDLSADHILGLLVLLPWLLLVRCLERHGEESMSLRGDIHTLEGQHE